MIVNRDCLVVGSVSITKVLVPYICVCLCARMCVLVCMCAHVYMHVNVKAHGCMCVHVHVCECVCVHVDIVLVCSFVSLTSYTHIGLSSLVFGQAGLTIDWNWTSQARGVSSCTCTLFCECVCMCVCVCVWSMYVCISVRVFITFLHVIKWGSIAQVSSSWTSLARGARSYTIGAS